METPSFFRTGITPCPPRRATPFTTCGPWREQNGGSRCTKTRRTVGSTTSLEADMAFPPIDSRTCIVRDTGARKGRTQSVAPGKTASQLLHYGRIILDSGENAAAETGALETGLICLKGEATVVVGAERFNVKPYDSVYVPRDAR